MQYWIACCNNSLWRDANETKASMPTDTSVLDLISCQLQDVFLRELDTHLHALLANQYAKTERKPKTLGEFDNFVKECGSRLNLEAPLQAYYRFFAHWGAPRSDTKRILQSAYNASGEKDLADKPTQR